MGAHAEALFSLTLELPPSKKSAGANTSTTALPKFKKVKLGGKTLRQSSLL